MPPADEQLIESIKNKLSTDNPIQHAKLEDNGTITWSSEDICNSQHMEDLARIKAELGRYMHLNTSAHGDANGYILNFGSQTVLTEDEFFSDLETFAMRDEKKHWVNLERK